MSLFFFIISILGALLSVTMDLAFLLKFFPMAYTNYEMFLFDSTTDKQAYVFDVAYFDIMSHFGVANMINHSLVFLFFLIIWKNNTSIYSFLFLIFSYVFSLCTKMGILISLFGIHDFNYFPIASVLFAGIGLVGRYFTVTRNGLAYSR